MTKAQAPSANATVEPKVSCGRCGLYVRPRRTTPTSWDHVAIPPKRTGFHFAEPVGKELERWRKWQAAQ